MRELRCMQQRLQQLETRAQQPAAVMPVATGPGAPLIADTKPGAMPPLKAPPPVNAPRADGADPNAPLPWGSAVTKSEADPTAKSGTTTVAKGAAEAPAGGAKPLAQANPASDCGPAGAPGAGGVGDLFALKPGAVPGAPGASPPIDPSLFALTPGGAPAGAIPGNKAILGVVDSPVAGLSMGAYGEIKFGSKQNSSDNGRWQSGFDAHRFVLLPTYAITKNIIFNAEIEFEHGGIAFDSDDKLHGTAEVEQLYIDFKIIDQFNWRAPGIDLVPIGHINLYHEPTLFYSVNRPELANGLVPTTFRAPATSVYGQIAEGWKYQIQASFSLEDFGDSFDKRTDANRVAAGGYQGGISGKDALALSRPVVGDFRQLSNDIAWTGRLTYSPAFLPGFAGSTSVYWTPNTTPRGAYADTGDTLGRSSLTLFNSEFRYRVPDTGLEFRGEVVYLNFGNPANLRANNDSDPTNNVGKSMWGYSGEVARHFPLGMILESQWEAVPFYRYTRENRQTKGFAGTDDNTPTGAGQLQYHTAGIAVFPSPKVVLKLNYQKVISKEEGGAKSDSVLGGLGIFF